ncbi:hypothetical protein [Paracoccus sp. (in: a-proteobacteria)]|uniref:hypothetical protein n=1 Tax=Paracoccus sp. TaxID=267 RepID=UPI0026DEAD8D|nr:hypothetical protein [Paracoccus sp. (in: a-proteobacteria)]MDO5647423.1 hypothetical protein [Paracoccus sp. (in: a-proteobacteria)]
MTKYLHDARAAMISGDSAAALALIERFSLAAQDEDLSGPDRDFAQKMLAELRDLAQAAQRGAERAMDDVRAIIQAAQSLCHYDRLGRRYVSQTVAAAPRRF